MNISIDAATASIITAFIVGSISIISTIIANSYSLRQHKEQWSREEEKARRAEQQALLDRELAHKKELINRLQEIYGNSIASLTALLIYTEGQMRLRPDYEANLKEVQKWLSHIVAIHYNKASKEYISFVNILQDTTNSYEGYGNIQILRSMVIDFVNKDPRLTT